MPWYYVRTLKACTTSSVAKRSNKETHGKCTIIDAVVSKLTQDKDENSQPRPSPRFNTLVSWNLPRKDGVPPQCNTCAIHGRQIPRKQPTKAITRRETSVRWNSTAGGWRFDPSAIYVRFMGRQSGKVTTFSPKTARQALDMVSNVSS